MKSWIVLLFAAVASAQTPGISRSAHWVIRTSKLEKTAEFLVNVFGMRILRHEENDKPCPITCNGDSPTAWSKTMIGYETEDKAYALEVTYNYGVESYKVGSGLSTFSIAVDDLQKATTAASDLGYMARNNGKGGVTVIGPDGYRFLLVAKGGSSRATADPFLAVKLSVSDAAASAAWYTETLGMAVLGEGGLGSGTEADATLEAGDVALAFPSPAGQPPAVALVLRGSPSGTKPRVEQYEGRHAISLPAAALKAMYAKILAESPELIVHEIMELEEQLGTLFIAIVKDADGFELCLVSSETFDKAVLAAADFVGPDYALRATLIAERKAAAAKAKAKAKASALLGVLGGGAASTFAAPAPGTPALDVAKAVFAHVAETLKAGTHSKTEGNFFATGAAVGAVLVTVLRAMKK